MAVEEAKEAIENGKCVVIGLQNTGEVRTYDAINCLSTVIVS